MWKIFEKGWPFLLAFLLLFHPHIWKELQKVHAYFSNPTAQFWGIFTEWDLFELVFHHALPIFFLVFGLRRLKKDNDDDEGFF